MPYEVTASCCWNMTCLHKLLYDVMRLRRKVCKYKVRFMTHLLPLSQINDIFIYGYFLFLPFIHIGMLVPQYFPPGHSVGIKLPAGELNRYHPGSRSWSQIGLADGSDNVTWERCRLKLRFGWFWMTLWFDGRHGSIASFLIILDVIPPSKIWNK